MSYGAHETARWVTEPVKSDTGAGERGPFARDRARVMHSAALRRLAGKTQVVGVGEDDFPRTRLTHSLECAQVGRELGQALGADPDLVDAACLAHDLGHPPFGHNGEAALDAVAQGCGGFEGNAQSLRILTRLEAKVLAPTGRSAGLNLTRATLDAATKYPWPRHPGTTKYGVYDDDAAAFEWLREGVPQGRRCLESQVMDWSDDVAYSVHDVEDGVHAGSIDPAVLDDASEQQALCRLTAQTYSPASAENLLAALETLPRPPAYGGELADQVALKAWTSGMIARLVGAATAATRERYGPGGLTRYAADLIVPAWARAECALLKGLAARYVMALPPAVRRQAAERTIVTELVGALLERGGPALDPALRVSWVAAADDAGRLRVVIDQVARLTDGSALAWHARLVGRA